jgi:TldD protein
MPQSRRAFLQQVSVATALGLVTRLPGRELWALTPAELLPEPDEALLRNLALTAIEAARAAGATFADVRVSATRAMGFLCGFPLKGGGRPVTARPPDLMLSMAYGVRVVVGGVWGFAGGTDMTADGIAEAARRAVAAAKTSRPRQKTSLELASAPAVPNGRWETPIKKDPFSVSLKDQIELSLAVIGGITAVPEATGARAEFGWRRPISVFASSEGSLIVQRFAYSAGGFIVNISIGPDVFDEGAGGATPKGGPVGYEMLEGHDWAAELRDAARKAVELTRQTRLAKPVEVGRYDLVFGAEAIAGFVVGTICEALNADRALGYQANRAGTSFAAPPLDMLGQYRLGSPLLTITADRSRPGGAATVGWDDEGVKPIEHTIVREGIITDYHTNRETAPQLGEWYRKQRRPVVAQGNARRVGANPPAVLTPNLTIQPGPGATTLEDLIHGVKKGFFVESATNLPDQQIINSQCVAWPVRQITNGRLGGYVKDFGFQYLTPTFWKALDALGGAASSESLMVDTDGLAGGDPMQPFPSSTVDAVPGRIRQVNVMNMGRTA